MLVHPVSVRNLTHAKNPKLGVDWNRASLGSFSKWFIVFFLCYSFVRWVTLNVLNFLWPVSFPLYWQKNTYQRQDIHLYRSVLTIMSKNNHFSCYPVCSYHPLHHTACYWYVITGLKRLFLTWGYIGRIMHYFITFFNWFKSHFSNFILKCSVKPYCSNLR